MGIKALADAVAAKVARRNAVKVVTDQMTEREAARQARIRHRDQVRHDMPAREDLVESKVRAVVEDNARPWWDANGEAVIRAMGGYLEQTPTGDVAYLGPVRRRREVLSARPRGALCRCW
jgi:hypothetical protein